MVPLKLFVKWQRMLKNNQFTSFLSQIVQHLCNTGKVFSWFRCPKDTETASSGHCGSVQLRENDWPAQVTKVTKIKKRISSSNHWTLQWHNDVFDLTPL